jgi:hypothetical protein
MRLTLKAIVGAGLLAGAGGVTYQYGGEVVDRVIDFSIPATLRVLDDGDPLTPPLPFAIDVQVADANGVVAMGRYPIDAEGAGAVCGKTFTPGPPAAVVGAGGKLEFDDPYEAGKACVVPLPSVIPDGTGYRALATFIANCPNTATDPTGTFQCPSTMAQSGVFAVQTTDPCIGQIVLDLGDWTRSVPVKGLARVQFSLLRSAAAVTHLELQSRLDGTTPLVGIDDISGSDLKKVSGVYFALPFTPGRYALTLIASNPQGCAAGSDRPMSVVVQ